MQTLTAPARSLVTGGGPDEPGHDPVTIPGPAEFAGDALYDAPELAEIAGRLIDEVEHLWFLTSFRRSIAYRWKRKGGASKGRLVMGGCKALGADARHFAGRSYLVWLPADVARIEQWPALRVEQELFNVLCSFAPARGGPVIVGPDCQVFTRAVERYGAWRPDLAEAREVFGQLPLDAANGNGHGEL